MLTGFASWFQKRLNRTPPPNKPPAEVEIELERLQFGERYSLSETKSSYGKGLSLRFSSINAGENACGGSFVSVDVDDDAKDDADEKPTVTNPPPEQKRPLPNPPLTLKFLLHVLAHFPPNHPSLEKSKEFALATAVLIKLIQKGEYEKVDAWRLQHKGTPLAKNLKRIMLSAPLQTFWAKQLSSPESIPRILKQLASSDDSEHINRVLFGLIQKGKFPVVAEWFVTNQHTKEAKMLREKLENGLPEDKQPWYDLMADTKSVYLYNDRVPLKPHVLQGASWRGFKELHPFDMLLGEYCRLKVYDQVKREYRCYKLLPDLADKALKGLSERNFQELEDHTGYMGSSLEAECICNPNLKHLPELMSIWKTEFSHIDALFYIAAYVNRASIAFDARNFNEMNDYLEKASRLIKEQSIHHPDLENLPPFMPALENVDFSQIERFEALKLDFSRIEALIKIEKDKYEQKRDAYVSCGISSNAMLCEFALLIGTEKLKRHRLAKERVRDDFIPQFIQMAEEACQRMPSSVTHFYYASIYADLAEYFREFEEAESHGKGAVLTDLGVDCRFNSWLYGNKPKNIDDWQRDQNIDLNFSDLDLKTLCAGLMLHHIELSKSLYPHDENIVFNTFQEAGFPASLYACGRKGNLTPFNFKQALLDIGCTYSPNLCAASYQKAQAIISALLVKEPKKSPVPG